MAETADILVSMFEVALGAQQRRRYTLYRMRTYFEHFYNEEVRERLLREEKRGSGRGKKPQREAVIQRELDRFIFQEGFFPITHCQASRGSIDTLVEEAAASGLPPILLELKQDVRILSPDPAPTAKELEALIEGARLEASRYCAGLAARPGWEGTVPFVVVFHTCPGVEDIAGLADDTTLLVDVGRHSPSLVGKRRSRVKRRP